MITVATWNVLHRVHAENWRDADTQWPDESERIADITARVASRPETVIALQEVSGDQLAALRVALPDRAIHVLRYPRVPRLRRGNAELSDPTEHLVLVVDGLSRLLSAEPFDNDPGKGAVVVQVGELTVIATHVTGDDRRTGQFAHLTKLASTMGPVVLLGDFNVDRDTVESALGSGFTVAQLPPDSAPTRPRTASTKSQFIDHVVVRDATVTDAAVHPAPGLSDHNLLSATLTF
ncbi:endonuclease/exonuclease/phosphatase family protein [Nocardia sp. XZ_19_385]|uniref:endonuclease/exonuclease/phosphatase family protein n=1 Tax=Nocardia sp. XZ_19_385 TaxID=2769488 RepID=UPI00188F37CE|nr:endonuclease/exonuclease/phosphatase family protein [Nocardia sp. XZ_19_385]